MLISHYFQNNHFYSIIKNNQDEKCEFNPINNSDCSNRDKENVNVSNISQQNKVCNKLSLRERLSNIKPNCIRIKDQSNTPNHTDNLQVENGIKCTLESEVSSFSSKDKEELSTPKEKCKHPLCDKEDSQNDVGSDSKSQSSLLLVEDKNKADLNILNDPCNQYDSNIQDDLFENISSYANIKMTQDPPKKSSKNNDRKKTSFSQALNSNLKHKKHLNENCENKQNMSNESDIKEKIECAVDTVKDLVVKSKQAILLKNHNVNLQHTLDLHYNIRYLLNRVKCLKRQLKNKIDVLNCRKIKTKNLAHNTKSNLIEFDLIPEDNIPNSKILFKIEDFNEQLAKSLVSLKRHKSSLSYSCIKNVDKKIEVKNKFKSPVQETRLCEEDDFQPKKKRNLELKNTMNIETPMQMNFYVGNKLRHTLTYYYDNE